MSENQDRGRLLRQAISLIKMLDAGWQSYATVEKEFGCCNKTARRMIAAAEVEIPLEFSESNPVRFRRIK